MTTDGSLDQPLEGWMIMRKRLLLEDQMKGIERMVCMDDIIHFFYTYVLFIMPIYFS